VALGKEVSRVVIAEGEAIHRRPSKQDVQLAIKRIKKLMAKSGAMDVRTRKSNVSDSYYITGVKKYKNGSVFSFIVRVSDHESGPIERAKNFDWHGQIELAKFEEHLRRSLASGHVDRSSHG
jgi:hypothetical protein